MFGILFAGTANFLFLLFFVGSGFASHENCFVILVSTLVGIGAFFYSTKFLKSQKILERICGGAAMFINAFVGLLSLVLFFSIKLYY